MKVFIRMVRLTLVALAIAGTVMPHPVWAKGPSGHVGVSSHSSSTAVNRVNNSATVLKLKDSKASNILAAPNGNTGFSGMGLPHDQTKSTASFTDSPPSLGVFSAMTADSTLQTQEARGRHDQRIGDYPTGPLMMSTDHNTSAYKADLASIFSHSQQRPQHPNDKGDSQGNARDNQMITKLQENASYTPSTGFHVPSFAVTKVKVDSTANIKQLKDQDRQIVPKLPGPLNAAPLKAPVAVLAKSSLTNTQDMHTMMLPIPDPTGGLLSGAIEAGEAIFGGGEDAAAAGGAAAASSGAAAAGTGLSIGWGSGVSLTGAPILGGLPGTPMEVANAVGAAGAQAAQAAQSAVGGAVLAGSVGVFGIAPAAIADPSGLYDSISYYRQGPTNEGAYLDGRDKLLPGANQHGPHDGPTGKKQQFLSTGGTPSIMDVVKSLGSPTAGATGSAINHNEISSNIFKNGVSATSVIPRSTTISSVPTQTLPAHLKDNGTTRTMPKLPFPTTDLTSSGSVASDNSSASDSPAQATSSASQATAPLPAEPTGADLVLEDVKLAAPATIVAGPAYTIKFRNQGTAAAGKFQVAILAGVDGKLTDDAPRAAIEIQSLAAGELKEVTLRLPQSAMKLAGDDGKPIAFTRLFIAVDLMNTVAETDESNNTAIVDRAALETTAAN